MARPLPPPPIKSPPYPPGGGGSTPVMGGGAGAGAVNIPNSNGGVFGQTQAALFPCFSVVNNRVEYHSLDPANFNDPSAACHYSWKVEQGKPYRQATIRRLIVTFRDLGQVTATWTITGVNDQQKVISISVGLGFGNKVPTGRLMTVPVDIVLTGLNLQVSVDRPPNGGNLSIVQVVRVGEIEETNL